MARERTGRKEMIELNQKQKQAAQFLDGIAAVIAIPGSGKTLTMTSRIGMLVKSYGIAPENILGLTFTRNAAQAMRNRLVPILDAMASRVTLLTIHSFCHSLLRNEGKAFEILSGKEQIKFIRKIMQKMKARSLPIGMAIREISLAKNNLISIEEFRSLYEGDALMQRIADLYERYEQEKKKKLLLDFDDLLVETYCLLSKNEEVKEKYQQTFRHILIDEYQDVGPAQMEILKLLIGHPNGNGSSFWVCGDDAQAIFSFTGASIGNILNFKRLFPDAAEYILNINYRSTPQILKACENLIRHNVRKIDKSLRPHHQDGEDVVILECTNEEDEASKLVSEVCDLVDRRGYDYRDIAVLYRANYQSRVIEEAFAQHHIPFYVENGLSFYDRFEVRILLQYLRLIANPNSDEGDEALRDVINIPNRYLGRKFLTELEAHAEQKGVHLYEGLRSIAISPPYLKKNVKDFLSLLDPLVQDAKGMEPAELLHLLRESLDYDKFITDEDVPSPDDSKVANINQLQIAAAKYRDVQSLLNYAETFQCASTQDKEGVALMTIHKSKGLEYPVVFMIGLVEGILPHKNGDIEEERRIAFVGLSRAMKLLYVSYSQTCLGKQVRKSSFVDEMLGLKD
jgi:DNA helicase-2/ATP-dependent DNA helicase PcrA